MSHGRVCICDTVLNHRMALTWSLTTHKSGYLTYYTHTQRFVITPDMLGLCLNNCVFSFFFINFFLVCSFVFCLFICCLSGCLFVLSACSFLCFVCLCLFFFLSVCLLIFFCLSVCFAYLFVLH